MTAQLWAPERSSRISTNGLDGERSRPAQAVFCTLAVAWLLLGARWASYVGSAPVFLTDVLVLAALCHLSITRLQRCADRDVTRNGPHPPVMTYLLFWWAAIRLAFGTTWSLDSLRDFAPYAYSGLAAVTFVAVTSSSAAGRARSAKLIVNALAIHSLWCFAVFVVDAQLPERLPTINGPQGIHVFSVRSDFDTALVGVFIAIALVRLLREDTHRKWLYAIAIGMSTATLTMSSSRGGVLGAMSAIVVGLLHVTASRRKAHQDVRLIWAVMPLLLVAFVSVLPTTTFGQRLVGAFDVPGQVASAESASGYGTAQARLRAWNYLLAYSFEDSKRFMVGVGFGPDFMGGTEASRLLVGAGSSDRSPPRSPHNYWLGTLLRLGLVGALLALSQAVAFVRTVRRHLADIGDDSLVLVSALLGCGLLLPATFGVVLESPFGAVPYFWAVGVTLAFFARSSPARYEVIRAASPQVRSASRR